MRYYDYISTSKVDMLSGQFKGLPYITQLISKVNVDIGGVKAELSSERESNKDRVRSVERVEKILRKKTNVGTIDSPESWFEGEANAIVAKIPENFNSIFYFLRTEHSYVALGGSRGHLLGADPSRKSSFGMSYADFLIDGLLEVGQNPWRFFRDDEAIASSIEVGVSGSNLWESMIEGQCARRREKTFDTPIKFLAKRIKSSMYRGKHTLLGSPLYIERL